MMRNLSLWALGAFAALAGVTGLAAPASAAPPSYALAGKVSGPDGGWDYSTFDPAARRLYVARSDGVTALDVDTLTLTGHLTDGQSTHKVVPLKNGAEIAVTNRGTNGLLFVDAKTGHLIADVPTVKGPDGALFDPASRLVLVLSHSGELGLVDPRTHAAVGSIPIPGAMEEAAAVDGKVFVNLEDKGQIAVVDVRKRAVLTTYPLEGCEGPGGMAYAEQSGLLISACANNVAKVVRASDGSVVATIQIGKGPDGAMYDPDRRLAFIPCGRDGVLDVIAVPDAGHVALVQTVKTELGARTGALDAKTGRIYLPTATYDTAHFGPGRFPTVPGTFVILVVAPQ
jgi:DNA-binding beta-propeller fold protein YncE